MKRIAFILGVLLSIMALLLTLTGCGGATSQKDQEQENAQALDREDLNLEELSEGSQANGLSPSETALQKAQHEGKPVLLNFHSTQCSPCIEIEKIIYEVMPDYEDKVAFVIVNVYDQGEQSLCDDYNIQTIPTTIFLNTGAEITEEYTGVIDEASMRQMLDRLIGKT